MPNQTGPRTPAGKAKSSRNAVKHGLASHKIFVLDNENPASWELLFSSWVARLQPRDECENDLVLDIAHSQWRIRRAKTIETALLDIAMDDRSSVFEPKYATYDEGMRQGDAWQALTDNSKALENIHRYENRARRAFERSLAALARIRSLAPAPAPAPTYMREFRDDVIPGLPFESEVLAPVPTPASPAVENGNVQNEMPAANATTEKSQSEPRTAAGPGTENVQNEMPKGLAAELAAHLRRDPLFDPRLDASQMSRHLRRWWEKNAA